MMKTILTFLFFSLSLHAQVKDSINERFEMVLGTFQISEQQKQLFRNLMKETIYKYKNEGVLKLENQELPSFSLQKLAGGKLWSETLRGKPTVLVFWNSNSQLCIDQAPTLNNLKKQYKNEANFIAITYQDEKEVHSFLEDVTFDHTHLIAAKSYIDGIKLIRYPKTIIADADLIIRYIGKPEDSKTALEDIESLQKFKTEIKTVLNDLLEAY